MTGPKPAVLPLDDPAITTQGQCALIIAKSTDTATLATLTGNGILATDHLKNRRNLPSTHVSSIFSSQRSLKVNTLLNGIEALAAIGCLVVLCWALLTSTRQAAPEDTEFSGFDD